jgi:hypothetical protein
MKKLLAAALLSLTVATGWAQGTIDFRNGGVTFPAPAGIDRLVYLGSIDPANRLTGVNYAAGLFYVAGTDVGSILSPTAGTQAGALAPFRVSTTASPGTWLNPTAVGNTRVLDGVGIGGSAVIQIRVWDTTKFASYAAAFQANQYGASTPFVYVVPAAGSPADAYYLTQLRAFTVSVPEPSTIALGVLGLGSLLLFRRKK